MYANDFQMISRQTVFVPLRNGSCAAEPQLLRGNNSRAFLCSHEQNILREIEAVKRIGEIITMSYDRFTSFEPSNRDAALRRRGCYSLK